MANLIYRESTTATIPGVTSLKGSALSNLEIDGNFRSINTHLTQHDTNISSIQYDLSILSGNITALDNNTPSNTGTGASGTWRISITGNAGTVTNGVYTTGNQTIAGVKTFSSTISGSIDGNAATVTNGVYTTGNQTIAGVKTFSSTISGSIDGNAATVTNGVYTTGNQTIAGTKTFTGEIFAAAFNGSHKGIGAEQPGMVSFFAMTTAPQGWLKANGDAVSRTTYANLFAAIGTTYGAGDGSTTFNLPDLRGEFLRSLDDGRGVDTGRTIGSSQAAADNTISQFESARNPAGENNTAGAETVPANGNWSGWRVTGRSLDGDDHHIRMKTNGVTDTRPRNVALLVCIKY